MGAANMALTVILRLGQRPDERDPILMLDAPRIVIGRSANCEIWLPDPSVSMRHACIRRSKGKTVIIDEGSLNGIVAAGSRLPAQTPHTLRDGEFVRVGRVWLQIQLAAGVASGPEQVEAAAMAVVERALEQDGDATCPQLLVTEGPDEGAQFTLAEAEQDYTMGRSEGADFVLADEGVSRRHISVGRVGAAILVRDLGSKEGTWLQGVELPRDAVPWDDGQSLALGSTVLTLRDPLAGALAEMMVASDVKMGNSEYELGPPATPAPTAAAEPAVAHHEAEAPVEEERMIIGSELDEGIGGVDIAVVILAFALLALSAVGLMVLLG